MKKDKKWLAAAGITAILLIVVIAAWAIAGNTHKSDVPSSTAVTSHGTGTGESPITGENSTASETETETVTEERASFESTEAQLSLQLTLSSSDLKIGENVKISAKASGGKAPYTYKFGVINLADGEDYVFASGTSSAEYDWSTMKSGKKTVYAEVTDSTGCMKRAQVPADIKLDNALLSSAGNTIKQGTDVTLTASITGDTEGRQYRFMVNDPEKDEWYMLRDYADSNSVVWNANKTGKKTLYAFITDPSGIELQVSLEVEVVE